MKYIKNYKLKKLNIFSGASLILLASCNLSFADPGIYINDGTDFGCIWTYDHHEKSNIGNVNEYGLINKDKRQEVSLAELGISSLSNTYEVCGSHDRSTQNNRALFYGTDSLSGSVSLTLGGELFVNGGNLGLGGGVENHAMRIGSLATLSTNSGIRSLAIGAGDQATVASGDDSIAIGTNAQAMHRGSVALGSGSITSDAVATSSMLINNQNHAVAGTVLAGTVSVGSKGAERTIINVGAGRVNELSTDAVNGSQLHNANEEISGLSQKVTQVEDRLKDESTKNRTYTDQEVSKLINTAAQNDQKVLKEANIYTDDKVAQINNRVDANGAAINNNSQKIKQLEAGIDATNSSAVKYDLNDDGTKKNTVSLHGGDENSAVTISNVAAGVNGTDAVNVDQLEGRLKDEATNNRNHTDQRVAEVKAHVDAADHQLSRDIQENDAEILATNQSLDKANEKLVEVDTFSVKYGQNEDGTKNNVVALQGGDPNAPVLLENIASGVKTNDAVNVGQLKDSIEAVSKKAHSYTDERIAHTRDYVDQKAQATLGQANAYTDEKFGQLSGEIVATRKEARQAAAIGLAAASLRYDDRPSKLSVAAGGGFWRGESAFSAGMGYTNDEGKVRANVSATHAGGHLGVGAGISYTFN